MKCPNCGEELGEDKKCNQCGETVKSTKTQEKANSFETIQGNGDGSRKTNKLGFVFLAMFVIIIALGGYYALAMNRPRYIFDKKISELINTQEEIAEFNTLKTKADLELSIQSDDPAVQEMANLLKDTKFSLSTEFDKSTQEELVGLQLSKANETLLDASLKLEAETQNLYVNLGQLFDKTILADMAVLSDETFEIADTSVATFGQKMSSKKAQTIFESELKAELKEEYFSAEKTNIQGENVTKNTLKLSAEECIAVIRNVCKNLSENEQFIDCFEDGETLKAELQDVVDELEAYDVEEDMEMIVDVYTVGFLKKVKRVDISVEDENSRITMQLTQSGEDEYAYELLEDNEKILDGNIKIKEENNDFSFEMTANAEGTEAIIKLSGNTVYNEALSDFDTSHVVKYEELTTADIYTLFGNFMNSKLYQMIQEFSGNDTNSLLTDDSDEEVGNIRLKSWRNFDQLKNKRKNV